MKFLKLMLILCIFCSVAVSCEQLAEPLPPYTQDGKHIVACKINNQVWVNGGLRPGTFMSQSPPNPQIIFKTKEVGSKKIIGLYISAYRYTGQFNSRDGRELGFSIDNFRGRGGYPILNASSENRAVFGGFFPALDTNKQTKVQGMIEVRYWDEKKRIVAGTFEYDVYIPGDTVKVREGRFDVRY